jgi:hypothetical protein
MKWGSGDMNVSTNSEEGRGCKNRKMNGSKTVVIVDQERGRRLERQQQLDDAHVTW